MAADFKLYRKFYQIQTISTGSTLEQSYVLIDPFFLSANTYFAGTGHTESNQLVESSLIISQDSTGIYYATLNPTYYAGDQTYDLVWYTNYTSAAPLKKLTTRFRINNTRYVNQIEVEINNSPLEIEITNEPLDIEILGSY